MSQAWPATAFCLGRAGPAGVLFHGTSGDAPGELALEDDEEDDGRDDTQQRCGCQGGGFHRVLPLERGQGQRDGLHVVAHQERHRDHVFVPRPDEEEHEQHTDSGPGDRQHHLEQRLPAGGAVDGCGLEDGLRERAVHGGEQVGAVRALDDGEDDDDRELRVVQPGGLEHGVQRVEQCLLRHHVRQHDAQHDPCVAFDATDAQREGVEHGQHHGGHGDDQGDDEAVEELHRELRGDPEGDDAFHGEGLRQAQWADCVIVGLRLEGVDGQHEQREQDDQCGDDQQDQRHPVACRADVLRLVRYPLRHCGGHCLCHGSILDFRKMRFGFFGVWSGVVSLESDHVLFDTLLDDGEHHGEDDDDHGQGGGDGGAVADLLHLEELVVRVVGRHCGRGARPALGQ